MLITNRKRNIFHALTSSVFLMLLLPALAPDLHGQTRSREEIERRVKVGLELFPNILSVDLDILDKRSPEGVLELWIIHHGSGGRAETIVREMGQSTRSIRQTPVRVLDISALTGAFPEDRKPCGVFLLDPLPDKTFARIRDLAARHRFILFSPYVEDMGRGATVGLKINSKIRLVVNHAALQKAVLRLHPEFLRLSIPYE